MNLMIGLLYCLQFGEREFARKSGARIVRIARHPDFYEVSRCQLKRIVILVRNLHSITSRKKYSVLAYMMFDVVKYRNFIRKQNAQKTRSIISGSIMDRHELTKLTKS